MLKLDRNEGMVPYIVDKTDSGNEPQTGYTKGCLRQREREGAETAKSSLPSGCSPPVAHPLALALTVASRGSGELRRGPFA
jgi:hypothetical protein